MTVLATAFALAPLALALGEGSQLMQPLAIAVIGGFVLSGPLVLWSCRRLPWLDPRGRLAGRPGEGSRRRPNALEPVRVISRCPGQRVLRTPKRQRIKEFHGRGESCRAFMFGSPACL